MYVIHKVCGHGCSQVSTLTAQKKTGKGKNYKTLNTGTAKTLKLWTRAGVVPRTLKL
jgi:hypothetical protein